MSSTTIVLVHGAYAESSSWDGVIESLAPGGTASSRGPTRCAASRRMPPH